MFNHGETYSTATFAEEVAKTQAWMNSERFRHAKRRYTAEDVVRLRGTTRFCYKGAVTSRKLWNLLKKLQASGGYSHTFGALDPVQVVQMAEHLSTIYVSGWQCSSTASTTNEPGPDFADYPYNTVPNKVDQLFRAQFFHDRKQREARLRMTEEQRAKTKEIDYFRPIIADGDTGFGGQTSVMKLIQLFIEAGAAGVHMEDQRPGAKKCGHMGGKVLVATQEHIDRLQSARLISDVLGAETVIIARTDAEAAQYLDSNIDPYDHCWILGSTNSSLPPLNALLLDAERRGSPAEERQRIQADYEKNAGLMTYGDAVLAKVRPSPSEAKRFTDHIRGKSITEARAVAKSMFNVDVYFDWDGPRTREGYYRVKNGDELCIARGIAFAPYADLVWAETSKPILSQATKVARGIKAVHPHQMLAYNCSPSFNWSGAGMSDAAIASFQKDLSKEGYVWQFITLAGFHLDGLGASKLAKDYAERGMLAYVEGVQRPEGEHAPALQTHQKWSGTELLDRFMETSAGGISSTKAGAHGSTEVQFSSKL